MKQKGQGIIEFALIVPLLVAIGVAVVYVGIMFLDYTQYSNAARDAARDISVQSEVTTSTSTTSADNLRQSMVTTINKGSGADYEKLIARYAHPFTNIFEAQWKAQFYSLNVSNKILEATSEAKNADAVEVSIALRLKDDVESGSYLSSWFAKLFNLPPIHYKMRLEK